MIDTSKEIVADILTEQFIPDHVFVYVARGAIRCYDGTRTYVFRAGEYCLARKNRLARYTIDTGADEFEPVVVCIEEQFLRIFREKHQIQPATFSSADTFLKINRNPLIPNFIRSLEPYYDQVEKINQSFEDVKNEELLIILLKSRPELAGVLFDYGSPAKVDLEAFMNRNYTFNVSIDRFAYLTGRSLSAFKRDFKQVFNDTPNH
jgi:hypothetical protein